MIERGVHVGEGKGAYNAAELVKVGRCQGLVLQQEWAEPACVQWPGKANLKKLK